MATIDGTSGDDILIGGSEDDEIFGLDGDDLLEGQAGDDTLDGGSGDDTLDGGNGDDLLEGQAGNDTLDGGNGDDILFGGPDGDATGETVTIDFDTLNPDNADSLEVGTTYTEDGALLEGFHVAGDIAPFNTAGTGNSFIPFEGSTALFLNSVGGTTTLTSVDGSAFTLESIDVDELLAPSSAGTITFTGTTSGGDTVIQEFTIDGVDGFETLEFNAEFTDLVSVSWDQVSPLHQFDNIVLTFGTGAVDDGNDVLIGGNGSDELYGGTGDDELDGGNGSDVLDGGTGDDELFGGNGKDELFGGAGDDKLDGGNGKDELKGGAGNDILTGGTGDDTFVFANGDGKDTITDFAAGADTDDVIDLTEVSAVTTFTDVQASASQVGADTVIDFGDGDSITLLGVNVGELAEGDFLL
jgi:Ca2+-binding RTX toxin-like protein